MAGRHRPQVVIDTNVWISGLIFGGNPENIIRLFLDGQIIVVISEEIISELRRKISEKFPLFTSHLGLLEASIREDAVIVQLGLSHITDSRDVKDNMVLETAIAGSAEYIATGDNDLLVLDPYREMRIVNPAYFLKLMANEA